MFLKLKKRIYELMDTMSEMIEVLCGLSNPNIAVSDCILATNGILEKLENEKIIPEKSIAELKDIQVQLNKFINDNSLINEKSVEKLNRQIVELQFTFWVEVDVELNIVFFPYKASMWDSLESIYEAASKDEKCVVKVVPIPYYKLTHDKMIPTYEGENFPKNITITHYCDYNLEIEEPDIIFVHNIYDQYNTITRVHEYYFTSNLKKYTDMLVYVPYHISSFIKQEAGEMRMAYSLPSIANVDKVILAGKHVENEALRDGVPKEKILTLGSPKFDAIVKKLNEPSSCPENWKKVIQGKIVYLLNTGCMFFSDNCFRRVHILAEFLAIPKIDPNSVVIWRPHPLTEVSIMKYAPNLYTGYIELKEAIKNGDTRYKNIIFDDTDDYFSALKISDVLITSNSSILQTYLITEKRVIFMAGEKAKKSILPSDVFYYAYNEDESWFELVKKFSKGYDPLAKNRKGIASKVYANTDGSCGEKVYKAIKKCILAKRKFK